MDANNDVLLNWVLVGTEWSASRAGHFTPEERGPVTSWIAGCQYNVSSFISPNAFMAQVRMWFISHGSPFSLVHRQAKHALRLGRLFYRRNERAMGCRRGQAVPCSLPSQPKRHSYITQTEEHSAVSSCSRPVFIHLFRFAVCIQMFVDHYNFIVST
jgi:hypothetical protein